MSSLASNLSLQGLAHNAWALPFWLNTPKKNLW